MRTDEQHGTPLTGTCPGWCTDHVTRTEDYAGETVRFDSHAGDVFSVWPRLGDEWMFWLRLSRVDFTPSGSNHQAPTIVLEERGSEFSGRAIGPSEARALAAALVRCAEVVEAALTAVCAGCGSPVEPVDAEGCADCPTARPRLQLVERESTR